jgi:hypothetical protein
MPMKKKPKAVRPAKKKPKAAKPAKKKVIPVRAARAGGAVKLVLLGKPQPGDKVPGTDYTRCETACKRNKVRLPGGIPVLECIPDPANPCPDVDESGRCHCVGFLPDGKKWKEAPKRSDGYYDDDDELECWCVKKGKIEPPN